MAPPPPRHLHKVTFNTRHIRTSPPQLSLTPLCPPHSLLLLFMILLLPLLTTLYHLSQTLPPALTLSIALYLLLINLWTVLLYWYDKAQAQAGHGVAGVGGSRRRVRESTLHFCELAGGWPGAFWVQRWLRHKTRKGIYRVVFWGVVVGHEELREMWRATEIGSAKKTGSGCGRECGVELDGMVARENRESSEASAVRQLRTTTRF